MTNRRKYRPTEHAWDMMNRVDNAEEKRAAAIREHAEHEETVKKTGEMVRFEGAGAAELDSYSTRQPVFVDEQGTKFILFTKQDPVHQLFLVSSKAHGGKRMSTVVRSESFVKPEQLGFDRRDCTPAVGGHDLKYYLLQRVNLEDLGFIEHTII